MYVYKYAYIYLLYTCSTIYRIRNTMPCGSRGMCIHICTYIITTYYIRKYTYIHMYSYIDTNICMYV